MEEVDKIARRPDSIVVRWLWFTCAPPALLFATSRNSYSAQVGPMAQTILSAHIYVCFFFSCNMKLNLDYLLEMVWEYLSLIQIYTKKRGSKSVNCKQCLSPALLSNIKITVDSAHEPALLNNIEITIWITVTIILIRLWRTFRPTRFEWWDYYEEKLHSWARGTLETHLVHITVFGRHTWSGVSTCIPLLSFQCHSIHRQLTQQFKYALVWVSAVVYKAISQPADVVWT